MAYTTEQARDALQTIDPGCDRQTWIKVMTSAKAAGLDVGDVTAWSAASGNFKGERDVMNAWRSINEQGAVQAGTLFHMARANGWKPQQDASRHTHARAATPASKEQPRPTIRPGMSAAEVWDSGTPAPAGHGYIVRKGGRPDGLRVCAGGLRIGGHDMAGALLVPARNLAGELVSLQCIPANGPKMNLPGHPMRGVFVVGDIEPQGRAYVVEGIGQAWACWKATGRAAVVCFGWGRVSSVTREMSSAHPDILLVLVPDAGKEAEAAKIAEALGALVVNMPEGWPQNSDVNDLAQRDGCEVLAELLEAAKPPEPTPLPLGVVFADELPNNYTPPDELVQGVLTAGAGSMLYGDSNSGKTFLCIDMACAVARGVPWMGRKTEQGLVVYVAAESPASVRSRLQAYQQHHGCRVPHFAIVQAPLDLFTGDDDTEALIALVGQVEKRRGQKVRLIVGDTLARLSAGANENSGEDMGLVVRRFDRIRNECAAHFLLVHHSGKAAAAGARGWSGIRAAMDTEIEVTDALTGRCAEVTKQRDLSTKGERIGFTLERVIIGQTKWLDPATTCVVVPTDAPVKHAKGKRMGPVEGAVLEFLRARGVGIKRGEVVKHFAEQYPRTSIYRAMDALGESGMVNIAQESRMVCIADAAK